MPKYLELVDWIKEQIQIGKLQPGQKMYSENELKEMFSMSRQTVRHAISVLEQENIITRVQGSGTYVKDNTSAKPKKTRVAVITTYVDGYIFPTMIHGIEKVLSREGYSVQIAFTNNQHGRERYVLEDILEKDEVGGIIAETTKSGIPNPNLHLYKEIMKRKIPIIFVNSFYRELMEIPHVSMNDIQAGKIITQHLIDMGHKKIAGIFKSDDGQGYQRYAGFAQALNEAGLEPADENLTWIDSLDFKHFEFCKDKILSRVKGCTAVACYNDELAFALVEMLTESGIKVPEDISVIGIDDSELSVVGDVRITSVPHPMGKLGEKAAENLRILMDNSKFDANYEFDLHLIKRESVKDLRKS